MKRNWSSHRNRRRGAFEIIPVIIATAAMVGLVLGIIVAARTEYHIGIKLLISLGWMLLCGVITAACYGAMFGVIFLGCWIAEKIAEKYDFKPWIYLLIGDVDRPFPAPDSFFRFVLGEVLVARGMRVGLWVGVLLIGVYPTSRLRLALGDALLCTLMACIILCVLMGSIMWVDYGFRRLALPASWKRTPYSFTFYLLWPAGLATYDAVASGPGWKQTPAVVLSMLVTFLLLIHLGLRLPSLSGKNEAGSVKTPL